jgi:hypothetical protein
MYVSTYSLSFTKNFRSIDSIKDQKGLVETLKAFDQMAFWVK